MSESESTFSLSGWPPELTYHELEILTAQATTYALSHGLLYLPPTTTTTVSVPTTKFPVSTPAPAPTSAIHAPLSLFPSLFPRKLFQLAQRLQRIYNVLYARVAMDDAFLDEVMGSMPEDFLVHLWRIWKYLRKEGLAQPRHLGLFRSDYLLHAPKDDTEKSLSLKQVEFNTIASSFGPLSERTAAMHRYLHGSSQYLNASSSLEFPPNDTTAGMVEGLAAAHKAYNSPRSQILFVVQVGERNVFDQQWLEYELFEKHSIRVIRQTMEELTYSIKLDMMTRRLWLYPTEGQTKVEISVVYFRAGYAPSDYHNLGGAPCEVRSLLERSLAIKCPSIPLHLAGSKKVQQVLTRSGMLEKFLCDETKWGKETFRPEELDELRASWMGMWGLDEDDVDVGRAVLGEGEPLGIRKARESFASLVLKPQREGGGNNIYKEAIPAFLDNLSPKERANWIAMKLIVAPEDKRNYLVRADGTGKSVKMQVVSELGIYGWALFSPTEGITEKEVGWLLRTKDTCSNEGGIAAGFSVLDSLVLVN